MMLLTTSLPLLPPPSASLLPPLTAPSSDPSIQTQTSQHQQHHHRRQKHNTAHATRNNTLLALSTDERTINQRKMAIAMYGYCWLKPAGCAKTMLGRREEEVEREEVERQLREVELQERHAMEEAEQERITRRDELGEVEEGRDLDEDIPDADGLEGEYSSGEEGGGDEDEDDEGMPMGGDLDDEIPDGDEQDTEDEEEPLSPAGADGGWVYDTRREPDTDDEDQLPHPLPPPRHGARGHPTVAGVRIPAPGSDYYHDEREAEEMAETMLDEDEMYDHEVQHSGRRMLPAERDLDDDVPDADDDQAWEHTDTELEESEMDISILPGQSQSQNARSSGIGMGQPQRNSTRTSTASRSSGPWIADDSPIQSPHPQLHMRPPPLPQPQPQAHQAIIPRQRRPQAEMTPDVRAPSSNYFTSTHRSASTRAARIVSGNRQRPYRPDITRATRHQLALDQTPEMIDTPPLATATAPEFNEDLEEVETDVEGTEDEVDVTTPDPFVAPEHARAIGLGVPAPGFDAPRGFRRGRIGDPADAFREGQAQQPGATRVGPIGPDRNTTAATRGWLDGAAATLGVGGARQGTTEGSARRTLFQRATRRRNGDVAVPPAAHDEAAAPTAGTSSGGLFSSPNPGTNLTGEDVQGDWDTPENSAVGAAGEGQSQSQGHEQARGERRRSGRFLGGRRRGLE